jgi:hypothetical protein
MEEKRCLKSFQQEIIISHTINIDVMVKYINGAFSVHAISNLEIEKKVLAQLLPADSSFNFWRKKCPDLVNGVIICIAN